MKRLLLFLLLVFASPAPAQTGPTAETIKLRSHALDQDRTINVYVPPGYAGGTARYPVLYLLDGGLNQGFPAMVKIVDQDIARGAAADVIVVGIEAVRREDELTFREAGRAGMPPGGGAGPFRRFVVDEVKPWVEAHFRTGTRSALVGGSLAGLFVLETLLREPAQFTDYVAVSPSLWWANNALTADAPTLLAANPPRDRRLWLALADEGPSMGVGAFMAVLDRHAPPSLRWSFRPFPDKTHQTVHVAAAKVYVPELFPRQ